MRKLTVTALLLVGLLSGCITRNKIEAALWLNNGQDADLCGPDRAHSLHPELWDHGFYRRLNDGRLEFISFCDPRARDWISMHKDDFTRLMNEANIRPSRTSRP